MIVEFSKSGPAPRTSLCTGACCGAFQIQGLTLNEVQERNPDIGEMLIVIPAGERVIHPTRHLLPDGIHHFTCRYWDAETTLCTIYQTRPKMCRDFPDETPCAWCGQIGETFLRGLLIPAWADRQLPASS